MPLDRVAAVFRAHLGYSDQDKTLSGVLGQVMHFLHQSDDGFNLDKLKQALTYLGSLPVTQKGSDVFKRGPLIAFVELMPGSKPIFDREQWLKMKSARAGGVVTSDQEQIYLPPGACSVDATKVLKELYLAVLHEYHQRAWTYEYPPDAFKEWESSMMEEGHKDEALRDFTRNLTISGVSGNSQESEDEAAKRVDQIVSESSYPKEAHDKIKQWLKNNGGQKIVLGLLEDLILQGHFSDAPSALEAIQNVAGWSLSEGKLEFNFNEYVSVAMVDGRRFVMSKDGVAEATDKTLEDAMHLKAKVDDANKELRIKNKPIVILPSVLQLKGSVSLGLDSEGNVRPKVQSLKALSFTNKLLSPARLFDAAPKEEPHQNNTHGMK